MDITKEEEEGYMISLTFKRIYEIMFIKKFDEISSDVDKDTRTRRANIYAVKITPVVWKRKLAGNLKNLFSPEHWDNVDREEKIMNNSSVEDLSEMQSDEQSNESYYELDGLKNQFIAEVVESINQIRERSKGAFGEYDRMWLIALQQIIDSEPEGEAHPQYPGQYRKHTVKPEASLDSDYEHVNEPTHYDWFGEQAIDVIEKQLSTEAYLGFLKGNSLKYRIRLGSKPNQPLYQDFKKARWYEKRYDLFVKQNTPEG